MGIPPALGGGAANHPIPSAPPPPPRLFPPLANSRCSATSRFSCSQCSELNGFYKISFGPLAPSTGRCEIFALSLSRGDLVLHAPAGTERRRGKEVVRGTTGTADEGYITRDFWRSQTRVRQAIGSQGEGWDDGG